MSKIRIGIVGYGNLGKGVEDGLKYNSDMELKLVVTRRPLDSLQIASPSIKVINISEIYQYKDHIDVMILCGGSATDLPCQGPEIAKYFNTVDSFDNHERIYEYYDSISKSASNSLKTNIISIGWDPGLFSMIRLLAQSILPQGNNYTFWGIGVSQGHSDAIRRIDGVKDAIQYTIPQEQSITSVRSGTNPILKAKDTHIRNCYVVIEENADKELIENKIKNMPNYFANYITNVTFITEEEFINNHSSIPHGGLVLRSGSTGAEDKNNHLIEFSLKLDSNPEFTANVLISYARAAYRLNKEGILGVKTIFDVPPSYLSASNNISLIKELL